MWLECLIDVWHVMTIHTNPQATNALIKGNLDKWPLGYLPYPGHCLLGHLSPGHLHSDIFTRTFSPGHNTWTSITWHLYPDICHRTSVYLDIYTKTSLRGHLYLDICWGNIYPDNICPYWQHLSYHWRDFDQTLWTQFFGGLNLCRLHFFDQLL